MYEIGSYLIPLHVVKTKSHVPQSSEEQRDIPGVKSPVPVPSCFIFSATSARKGGMSHSECLSKIFHHLIFICHYS